MTTETPTRTIPFGFPIIGDAEKQAVEQVLNGPILVHGSRVKAFEADFAEMTGAPYALATASCTASLHLAYFSQKIGLGDEVIVPAQTHVATAHAVELCGATCVFVDAEPRTGNIDLDRIEEKITERTRAISVVHYLGMPVEMLRVMDQARKHDLFVVEDCALAIGSTYQDVHAGLWGDVGCFSFYPVKHLTTAEGGMLITKDESLAHQISRQRAFGVDRTAGERSEPGIYDVTMLGFNYRMNEIEAAIGIEQIKRMPTFLATREQNHRVLTEQLRDVEEIQLLESTAGDFKSSYYCCSVILNDALASRRAAIVQYLKQQGIGTSVYYPRPVPLLSYYHQKYGHTAAEFPVATRLSEASIALPVRPRLTGEDMEYVARTLKDAIALVSKL